MSSSLRPHGPQHTRPPCPSLSPGVCSNSCPLNQLCHSTILFCCTLLLLHSIFPSIRVFSNELALCIRWLKHWSFSFSITSSDEDSGLISFRIDCFDLLPVQGCSQECSPAPQFESINFLALSLPYGPTLTSIHDYWKKKIALNRQTFVDKVMSLLCNMLSRLVITFLPRMKYLLISWLQSPSTVIL